jgi:hypothetical protein
MLGHYHLDRRKIRHLPSGIAKDLFPPQRLAAASTTLYLVHFYDIGILYHL